MPSDNEQIHADGTLINYDFTPDEEFGTVKMKPFVVKVKKLPPEGIIYYGNFIGAVLRRGADGNFFAERPLQDGSSDWIAVDRKIDWSEKQIKPPVQNTSNNSSELQASEPVQIGGRMVIQLTYTYEDGSTYTTNCVLGPNGEWYSQLENGSWKVSTDMSLTWQDSEGPGAISLPPVGEGGGREVPQEMYE